MRTLITGAKGFVGRNLVCALREAGHEAVEFDMETPVSMLGDLLTQVDFVFHLAGVNRPKDSSEFRTGNTGLTGDVIAAVRAQGRPIPIALASSTQAALDNPYGQSKREAEELLLEFGAATGNPIFVFRFPNIFGKWCRPNYNSAVATFCHAIAHGTAYSISNRANVVSLCYVDDVVKALTDLMVLDPVAAAQPRRDVEPVFERTLGEIVDALESFKADRLRMNIPQVGDPFLRRLYSTYLSYLELAELTVNTKMFHDPRGWLFELARSQPFGQIFVSTTKPGITRGNHYHHTKVEKFCLIKGKAEIRIRPIDSDQIETIQVSDTDIRLVDIPPGCTHSITNTGDEEMIVIFWASEVFDPQHPDTHALMVQK